MEFPDDVLAIINDFSRPITRSDWRTLHRMTCIDLHLAIAREFSWTCPKVLMKFITNSPGEYVFNIMFHHSPYINLIFKRGDWQHPIRT